MKPKTKSEVVQLSDYGRAVEFDTWRIIGGCGLPNNTNVFSTLPPVIVWKERKITLGQIEDACPHTGRSLARFAKEHLNLECMAKPYDPEYATRRDWIRAGLIKE